ncbi:hypothetical protein FJM51_22545 [Amaricoccus solimangrovi]|uniref:ParB-like N-terminal domain-containing protein n=1 Tax=Amaricoccus solimangrovi TaxID=2589815 RepID=A0A501W6Z0_9RHOB|nr:hypothetical protein FJM51_22545 [Amaricoccus solimangrovi]
MPERASNDCDLIPRIAPDQRRPWPDNARTHSRKQVRQIMDSIRTFGFTNPVLIDEGNTILAGHGRVAAAKLLGMATVPCRLISSMTPARRRAYVIADNKLALNAGWNEEMLATEIAGLMAIEADLGFDVEVIGFSIPEIDSLIDGLTPQEPRDPADDLPAPAASDAAITHPGDVWLLGSHRLVCGDALVATTYDRLLEAERAQMVFTDSPYNVPIDGHVRVAGAVRHREFGLGDRGEQQPGAAEGIRDDRRIPGGRHARGRAAACPGFARGRHPAASGHDPYLPALRPGRGDRPLDPGGAAEAAGPAPGQRGCSGHDPRRGAQAAPPARRRDQAGADRDLREGHRADRRRAVEPHPGDPRGRLIRTSASRLEIRISRHGGRRGEGPAGRLVCLARFRRGPVRAAVGVRPCKARAEAYLVGCRLHLPGRQSRLPGPRPRAR